MLEKCANPSCSQVFRYSLGGTLFLFEPTANETSSDFTLHEPDHSIESFWLCNQCEASMTIISNGGRDPMIIPILEVDSEQIGTA
jgi:hypothetical protein